MGKRIAGLLLALGVAVGACGGVVEYDEDDPALEPDSVEGDGVGSPTGMGDCRPCAGGDCGMCNVHDGNVYQCHDGDPSRDDRICTQLGNLYSDAAGAYVCFVCD